MSTRSQLRHVPRPEAEAQFERRDAADIAKGRVLDALRPHRIARQEHGMNKQPRRERQRLEILVAVVQGRLSHALGLTFEHFGEFGDDPLVSNLLSREVGERGDPKLSAEMAALLARVAETGVAPRPSRS
jgi:hypothetical protein